MQKIIFRFVFFSHFKNTSESNGGQPGQENGIGRASKEEIKHGQHGKNHKELGEFVAKQG